MSLSLNFFKYSDKSFHHVLVLISGKAGASMISFIAAPIIARLFVPEDYGVAAVFIVTVNILSILFSLSYQNAIPIPKTDDESTKLMECSIIFSLILALISYIPLILIWELGYWELITGKLGVWAWFTPITALILTNILLFEGWLTRKKAYMISTKGTLLQATMTTGGRLSCGGVWGSSTWSLITPYITGLLLRYYLLKKSVNNSAEVIIFTNFTKKKEIAKRYIDFPKYNMPSGLMRTISDNLPILLFAPFFGVTAVGFMAMADRIIKAPMTMVAMSIRRVYLQRAATILHNDGNLFHSYKKVVLKLSFLSLLPVLIIFYWGEDIFAFILGEKWRVAGAYSEILSVWLYVVVISRPAISVIDLLKLQKYLLKLNLTVIFLRLSAMSIVWYFFNDEKYVLWAFVLSGVIPFLGLLSFMHRHLRHLYKTTGDSLIEKKY